MIQGRAIEENVRLIHPMTALLCSHLFLQRDPLDLGRLRVFKKRHRTWFTSVVNALGKINLCWGRAQHFLGQSWAGWDETVGW